MDYDIIFRFAIVLILVLIEGYFQATWNAAYFRIGIPLYIRKPGRTANHVHDFPADLFSEKLKKGKSSLHPLVSPPSIIFHKLNVNNIAFRPKFFEITNYNIIPVMRGLIKIDENNHSLQIIGLLNWYTIVLYVLYLSIIIKIYDLKELSLLEESLFFIVYPLIVFGICYFFQLLLFGKVVEQLKKAYRINKA